MKDLEPDINIKREIWESYLDNRAGLFKTLTPDPNAIARNLFGEFRDEDYFQNSLS